MIGGRFAPLTIMSNDNTDIDSMITSFNTAVTKTAREMLGKHRQTALHTTSFHMFLSLLFMCQQVPT